MRRTRKVARIYDSRQAETNGEAGGYFKRVRDRFGEDCVNRDKSRARSVPTK
jgi:hypothetical protein